MSIFCFVHEVKTLNAYKYLLEFFRCDTYYNILKMRKQWIKKENLYHKPFYKKKLQMSLLCVVAMAVIFFAYQLFYIKQLQTEIERKPFVVPAQLKPQEKETKRILR